MIKFWELYDKQDKKAVKILKSKYKLTLAQKLLLYVLYRNHQDLRLREGINLLQTEQELKKKYGENLSELLHLKKSYESLPLVLQKLVKFSFNVIESKSNRASDV